MRDKLLELLELAARYIEPDAMNYVRPSNRDVAVELHAKILVALAETRRLHATSDPLDAPGIELRDAVGYAVYTASEGEDPSFHAWFASRPTAEAYVKANEAHVLFEPHITKSAAKFASSHEDPEMPEARLTDAPSKHTDDHEKQAWKDLLEMALPWLRYSAGLVRPTPASLTRVINVISDLLYPYADPVLHVHFVTYKKSIKGDVLITQCEKDGGGLFTNHKPDVTCPDCWHSLEAKE
jgi:hypothetical protein